MAKLEMTLDEYGKSPAGKGNVTGSQYLAEAYKKKFEKARAGRKIEKNSWRCNFTKGTGTFKHS